MPVTQFGNSDPEQKHYNKSGQVIRAVKGSTAIKVGTGAWSVIDPSGTATSTPGSNEVVTLVSLDNSTVWVP